MKIQLYKIILCLSLKLISPNLISLELCTPYFLMFCLEDRTPAELIFGVPEEPEPKSPSNVAQTRYKEMSQCFRDLRNKASDRVIRDKPQADSGVTKQIYRAGDTVRVQLTRLHNSPGHKIKT